MAYYIDIDHGNKTVTRYQHLKEGSMTVKKGNKVTADQVIAYMGTTGASTGVHLHFGVKVNGTWIDPIPWLGNIDGGTGYPSPARTLYKGLSGDDVKWLQDKLNGYGYKLAVDGSFGAKTDAALRNFQENNGLTVDGRCGPATRAKLAG